MHAVSQSALAGKAPVIGVIPKFLTSVEPPKGNLTELIFVDSMSERKRLMIERADLFLILPGGVGTLDEVFEVITDNHLNLYRKPVGFLSINGYYDLLEEFLNNAKSIGFVSPKIDSYCFFDRDINMLIDRLTKSLPEAKYHS